MKLKERSTAAILDVPLFTSRRVELLETLSSLVFSGTSRNCAVIFTPNPEQFRLALHTQRFLSVLRSATYNLPDGAGVVWALKRAGVQGVERIPGRVLFHELLELGFQEHKRVLLIGGRPGSSAQVIAKYQARSSQELPWKSDDGAMDIAHETIEERERVRSLIRSFHPDMVFVAYGAPWQEYWVNDNRTVLDEAGVKIAMVVGGSFEYEAGKAKHVPELIERLHLEWLLRLVSEPWRWKRQLFGLEFFVRIFLFGTGMGK